MLSSSGKATVDSTSTGPRMHAWTSMLFLGHCLFFQQLPPFDKHITVKCLVCECTSCTIKQYFQTQSKANLGVEVGGGEVAAHSHPPWPNVVVLPKQLQPPPAYRNRNHITVSICYTQNAGSTDVFGAVLLLCLNSLTLLCWLHQ